MSAAIWNPNKTFYDRISGAYDAIADVGEHRARERGLEALAVQPGECVLEIGFGTGHSLIELAKAVGPTGCVCGVDISDGMYDVARHRLIANGFLDRLDQPTHDQGDRTGLKNVSSLKSPIHRPCHTRTIHSMS